MDPFKPINPAEVKAKASSIWKDFRAFAFKGNVIDLAVGVVIGAAFGKIIDSLVKQIIMPLISVILPTDEGYTKWRWVIHGKEILYGQFLGEVVNFLIVALALYLFIAKFLGWLMRRGQEQAAAAEPVAKEVELLMEIRDLLKQRTVKE